MRRGGLFRVVSSGETYSIGNTPGTMQLCCDPVWESGVLSWPLRCPMAYVQRTGTRRFRRHGRRAPPAACSAARAPGPLWGTCCTCPATPTCALAAGTTPWCPTSGAAGCSAGQHSLQLCSWALVMADMRRWSGGLSLDIDSKCLCRAPVDHSPDGFASLSCPGCAHE